MGIYKSLTDTSHRHVEIGTEAAPFLGKFVSNFRYCEGGGADSNDSKIGVT